MRLHTFSLLTPVLALAALVTPAVSVVVNVNAFEHLSALLASQHTRASSSLQRRAAGISPINLASDGSSYYTVLSTGNISFRVALDTASSDLWIVSSACSSNQCRSIPKYPLAYHSPSFGVINNNETLFNVSFADGSVSSGFLATETVQLQNFTMPQQVFGLVQESNVTFENDVSGILGMGFPRLSIFSDLFDNAPPFVNNLAQQGLLDYPLFGLSLTHDTGSLSLGAIDVSTVQDLADVEWHRVMPFAPFGSETNSSRYLQWAIPLTAIAVNGSVVTPQPTYAEETNGLSLALFDVGTNGIFGPYQDVGRIFQELSESRLVDSALGLWALPCDTAEVISFSFGVHNFTLQPTDYLIGPTEGNPSLCLSWPRAIASSSDGLDWQFGTPFLRTVYSIYSFGINAKEPPLIGLYPLSNITTINQTIGDVSSFFSSASTTIGTTLPNFPLATETPLTPAYLFNTSVRATQGQVATADLGTSTYSPILTRTPLNLSALPTITASQTLATLIVTDANGAVFTTTSRAPSTSVALGKPPGFNSANTLNVPGILTMLSAGLLALFATLLHVL